MASMRVHELAKEFDMTSKELLDRLHEMKIPAKSHASMLAALPSRRSARCAKLSALAARAVPPRARLVPSSRSVRLRRLP